MGNKFLDKQGLSVFLAQSKELFATDTAVTEVKTTTDNYVLNVDYTPLRFDTSEIVSGGSAGGGGGVECSGNHIIEVDTLPTENIDENALYKMGDGYYKYSKGKLIDVISVSGTATSFVELITQSVGGTVELFYVDNYENVTDPHPFDQATMSVPLYYDESRDDVFLYTNGAWASYGTMDSATNGGKITNISEATTEGYYYALVISGWVNYISPNGNVTIVANGTYDITDKASVTVNVILEEYDGTVVIS